MANINYGIHEFDSPKTGIGRVTLIDRVGAGDNDISLGVNISWTRNDWRAIYSDEFSNVAEAIRWAESVLLVYAEFTPAVCPVCYERIWPWHMISWSDGAEMCHDDCVVEVPGEDEIERCPICEFTNGNHDMHPGHECPIGKVSDQYRAGLITATEMTVKIRELIDTTRHGYNRGSGVEMLPEFETTFAPDRLDDEQSAISERRTYREHGW